MEGLEAIQENPGMYIGSVDDDGVNHCAYEVLANSVDEHMGGHGSTIFITRRRAVRAIPISMAAIRGWSDGSCSSSEPITRMARSSASR